MDNKKFLSIFCFLIHFTFVLGQKKIELLNADSLLFDQQFGEMQRLKGHVFFQQKDVFMKSDSAWFYEKENRLKAFGRVHIYQKDSFDLFGNYLEYDGNDENAIVKGNVELSDEDMTLRTESIIYDIPNKTAFYLQDGHINDNENDLISKTGKYFSRTKRFGFKNNVVLTNPKYKMTSDTLDYFTSNKTAYFYGPTYIKSKENTIYCNAGWYNTKTEESQFSKGAWIQGKENKLVADSLVYNRQTGIGKAFRDIILSDSQNNVKIFGAYAVYNQLQKKTTITINPLAIKIQKSDTLFLIADTLIDQTDTSAKRAVRAFSNARFMNLDIQGKADSIIYQVDDSTMTLYKKPILWTDSNQLSADTIFIFQNSQGIDYMILNANSFITSKENDLVFNQIKGEKIKALFIKSELAKVFVINKGESLYYVKEEDSTYSGVNKINCEKMTISIDSSKVKNILFLSKPKGTFYPIEELSLEKSRLQGFSWLYMLKPKRKAFILPNN